jgi:NADPH:quinone reductase
VLASWYESQGEAADVLHVGEMVDPEPGRGEVRVKVAVSGVNPGDTKKRRGWLGSSMPYPRVTPHSDASGVVDAVGEGVAAERIGERVWVYGAQSYRAFGTAAEYTVVPDFQAVPLPTELSDEHGASLGIPGITAHRAVFQDGSVEGKTVLVHGVLGGVGSLAAQLAHWGGAKVVGTVRRADDLGRVDSAVVAHAVALDQADSVGAILKAAPGGVQRVVEVALSDNADLDCAVVANGAVISAYATREERTAIPFWPLLFANVTLRLIGSDDFPTEAKQEAARDLTAASLAGALTIDVAERYPLIDIAKAHDHVDAGASGRILVTIP